MSACVRAARPAPALAEVVSVFGPGGCTDANRDEMGKARGLCTVELQGGQEAFAEQPRSPGEGEV